MLTALAVLGKHAVTERCPLPFQARARSPASNPRVILESWVQPQDKGRVLYIYNKTFCCCNLCPSAITLCLLPPKWPWRWPFSALSATLRAPGAVMYIVMLAGAAHGPGNR